MLAKRLLPAISVGFLLLLPQACWDRDSNEPAEAADGALAPGQWSSPANGGGDTGFPQRNRQAAEGQGLPGPAQGSAAARSTSGPGPGPGPGATRRGRSEADQGASRGQESDSPWATAGTTPTAPPPAPPASEPEYPTTLRSVSIEGDASSQDVTRAKLAIDAYLAAHLSPDNGLPIQGATPAYRWTSKQLERSWPSVQSIPLPSGSDLLLVAWLDSNQSGSLDEGDRCSFPQQAPEGGTTSTPVTLKIERAYLVATAPKTGTSRQKTAAFSSPSGAIPHGFGPEVTVQFIPVLEAARALNEVGLILFALPKDGFDESGFPPNNSEKLSALQWTQSKRTIQWPAELQVRLPVDPQLRMLAILDVDNNGHLSPGDHLSAPTPLPSSLKNPNPRLVFTIDRTLPEGPGAGPQPVAAMIGDFPGGTNTAEDSSSGGCGGGS